MPKIGEGFSMPLQVLTGNLGNGNMGSIGPQSPEDAQSVLEASTSDKYEKTPSGHWGCFDGRGSEQEVVINPETADAALAGGLIISETAAAFMLSDSPLPLSNTVKEVTVRAIADGVSVEMHGANGNKAGCAANAEIKNGLKTAAARIDILAPLAIDLTQRLGIDHLVSTQDVVDMIVRGDESAHKDEVWDASPEEVVAIAVNNGASYRNLVGPHEEKRIRADLTENVFDKYEFLADAKTADIQGQIFPAAFGAYKKLAFERAMASGEDEPQVALRVAAVITFNLAIGKLLCNGEMPVDIIQQ